MAGRAQQAHRSGKRGLVRRSLAAALVAAGAGLLAQALLHVAEDPRRSAALVTLVIGGMVLNLVSLARRHLAVRAWLRNLACAVGGVLLIAVFALRHHIRESLLPMIPQSDSTLRLAILTWHGTLVWLGVGVGYVVLSIAVLPRPRGAFESKTLSVRGGVGVPGPDSPGSL